MLSGCSKVLRRMFRARVAADSATFVPLATVLQKKRKHMRVTPGQLLKSTRYLRHPKKSNISDILHHPLPEIMLKLKMFGYFSWNVDLC